MAWCVQQLLYDTCAKCGGICRYGRGMLTNQRLTELARAFASARFHMIPEALRIVYFGFVFHVMFKDTTRRRLPSFRFFSYVSTETKHGPPPLHRSAAANSFSFSPASSPNLSMNGHTHLLGCFFLYWR